MFVGREEELRELGEFCESSEGGLMVLGGALGIGKTELIRQYFSNSKKDYIYYHAFETTPDQQIDMMCRAFGVAKNGNLDKLFEQILSECSDSKKTIVIDEYHYILKSEKTINDALCKFMLENAKEKCIKLILISSVHGIIDKNIIASKSKWHKILKKHLVLDTLNYRQMKQFFGNISPYDSTAYFAFTSGVPALIRAIEGAKDIKDAARLIFFNPATEKFLPPHVMSMELRELSYYNRLLSAMSTGLNRVNQISEELGKPKDVVVPYLSVLGGMGFVAKQNAITEEKNRKKTRYYITNSSVVFWYKFIVPHMNSYVTMDFDAFWDRYILPKLDEYLRDTFVKMCKEFLISGATTLPFSVEKSGNWWVNDEESKTSDGFDIVSLGKSLHDKATIFSICYFGDDNIDVSKIKEMIDKTKMFRTVGEVYYILCGKDKFAANVTTVARTIKNILLITLDDVCKMQ